MPITHELWTNLLARHVSQDGHVDYRGFIEDRDTFDTYINQLTSHHPDTDTWNEDERLAYWINAYNAFTVQLILDNYPIESIKDIKKGIPFINSVWDMKFIVIEGNKYNLNNIEHSILRKRFDEPRIHFAINCASISCPKLRPTAFEAATLEDQLTMATKDFLSDTSRNVITENKVELSRIFKWFGGDFKKAGSKIDFLNKHGDVKISEEADVSYLEYDWGLNGAQ